MSNIFGKNYTLTSFGESHGEGIGGILDGIPSGILLDIDAIQNELSRRRPGQSTITTSRNEEDVVEILSGLFEGVTTGMPLAFMVKNNNQKSEDYESLKEIYRPGHADFAWHMKYGIRDYRGGGRSSAREHIARVVGGAVAKQILAAHNIFVDAYTSQIGDIKLTKSYTEFTPADVESSVVRCPDSEVGNRMIELIKEVSADGDSIGGIVGCVIKGLPRGLGEPVFDKFQSRLAGAMMSINAAKGFEYGMGFESASLRGSQHNDAMIAVDGIIGYASNKSGGIQGGITNGEDVYFRVAFKPVSTIAKEQNTVDINGENIRLKVKGRHDPCVVVRAVPVVEAMAAMVTLDFYFENKKMF